MSYEKYSGKFQKKDIVKNFKYFHGRVKEYHIKNYCSNSDLLIDIGSGRGVDARHWIKYGIKFVIGIEPSYDSIKYAIQIYKKYRGMKNITKIVYLNGIGNDYWYNGAASLRTEDKDKFIFFFGEKKLKATNINLFWTIHYMMDTEDDFNKLLHNINNHISSGGIVTILCMDGEKIDKYFKENNGVHDITDKKESAFRLDALYDYKKKDLPIFGNKILVTIAGTYGLEKGIEENLVSIKFLIEKFQSMEYKLIGQKKSSEVPIPELKELVDYEINIAELYTNLVFKKN